jgi:hypothetical protein
MLISELVRYLHRACPESWALVLAEVAKHGRAAPQLADGVLVLSVLQTPEGPMPYMKLDVLQLRARAFQAAVSHIDLQGVQAALPQQRRHVLVDAVTCTVERLCAD